MKNYNIYTSSWTEARDILKYFREENVRKSEVVVELWERVLQQKSTKLGDEQYLVLEQVCTAAADVDRPDILSDCLQELDLEFPGSLRVRRLQVLKLEMAGKFEEALKFLDEIYKLDETNPAPRKKKVAIFKSLGNTTEAIRELVDYLKTFMSDREAWQELAELYLTDSDLIRAIFCLEEVVLLGPLNHLHHQRLADVRYTLGGAENLELAKAHYCLALKLCPTNVRALYGLILSASGIATSLKTQQKKKEVGKLLAWATKRLKELYADANSEPNLTDLMNSLQISSG